MTSSDPSTCRLLGGTPARVVVDLDAIAHNATELRRISDGADVMAVVKADGYGHGLAPTARAAHSAGVRWFGVAQLAEALALRACGPSGVRVVSWLHAPGVDYRPALEADVDLAAPSARELNEIADVARAVGRRARVHLKVDTGLARNGAFGSQWPELLDAAVAAQRGGIVEIVGIMSHLACADDVGHPENLAQTERFADACDDVSRAGLDVEVRHLANSAGTFTLPHARHDLVRPGIALYGLAPVPGEWDLRPAMSVTANVTVTKRVPAGQGVSYNHTFHAPEETTLADIPLGYADGVPRAASNGAPVLVGGCRKHIVGRVCMDQFVVEIGDDRVEPGDEVVLFGRSSSGEVGPSAEDWAEFCATITYEIVARMGARLPRVYTGSLAKEFGL